MFLDLALSTHFEGQLCNFKIGVATDEAAPF